MNCRKPYLEIGEEVYWEQTVKHVCGQQELDNELWNNNKGGEVI